MIINSSSVAMSSNRSYNSIRQEEKVSVTERPGQSSVTLKISEESQHMMEQMKAYKASLQEQAKQREADNLRDIARAHTENANPNRTASIEDSPEVLMLKRLLEAFNRAFRGKRHGLNGKSYNTGMYNSMITQAQKTTLSLENMRLSGGSFTSDSGFSTGNSRGTLTKTTVTSGFFAETELTAYEATGIAKTADGREISFGISVEMSRGFSQRYEKLTQEDVILCDPLVINLDAGTASVSDMKFLFDLDSDGTEEEISFAGKGSGFIALDRNGDGKINDGSELFGTKTQDGFAELAAYDEDGNGWIDEADSIFKDLKVWTKDANGNDVLMDLKSADVGALYLGSASTEFSLKDNLSNETNAVIRSTGVYLKESGGVGTLQHVDMAV